MTRLTVLERDDRWFSATRGSLKRARLEFARGAARLTVGGEPIPELFRARFQPPDPSVTVDGGTVRVRYPRVAFRGWLRPWLRRGGQVALNSDDAAHVQITTE
jgi:hypothetical protein